MTLHIQHLPISEICGGAVQDVLDVMICQDILSEPRGYWSKLVVDAVLPLHEARAAWDVKTKSMDGLRLRGRVR